MSAPSHQPSMLGVSLNPLLAVSVYTRNTYKLDIWYVHQSNSLRCFYRCQRTCWHLWFFANFTVISKCCKCFSPFSVLAHAQCCCSEEVNYTCLWKHDKWPVTLMFLWAFLLKHPNHLIISKRTGCYAGCLRHGYQKSRMRLKCRAFPTPHICECVKRSEKVHNHPFSTIKSTSRGYQSNTNG